ncbi:P-loop containing nucleoside triphosphate hydrolase protein [Basidiobolus meristosporus CBS 931.73]|uniref:p-loop containing nucleoside triphosphate hydrolase protein n=1 Tax=Basidiobolus meristosporus CBS 931.73 TaxID=1314790 RepID=A0A1Y1XVN7_9FUNG|nr:P-loop containing nucleoside triphosphate hydrolase protein [Basidiobolus meristosporus CBS 931.73]|eukprot:ORX89818.1 P-loop containing nucleoside triphosphate hydrolase protein [Basidiobolus meristosporus CBS 931.73]
MNRPEEKLRSSNSKFKAVCEPSKWRQFKALIRKQFLQGVRDRVSLYNGFLSPIYMVAILVIVKTVSIPAAIDIKPLPALTDGTCSAIQPNCVHMGYITNGPIDSTLMHMRMLFDYSEPNVVSMRKFASFQDLADHFNADPASLVVGVTFNNSDVLSSTSYQIHTNHTLVSNQDYVATKSLTIQAYIERAIANVRREANGLTLLSSPLPAKGATFGKKIETGIGRDFVSYTTLADNTFVKYVLPIMGMVFLIFTFQPLLIYYLSIINHDRKIKIKSNMLMMGLSHTVYLAAVWAYLLAFTLVPIVIVLIILYTTGTMPIAGLGYIIGSFIFYACAAIALCTIFSIRFNSTKTAPFAGLIITIVSIALAILYQTLWRSDISYAGSVLMMLIAPVAFGQIISLTYNYSTIEQMNHPPFGTSLSVTFAMLFVDAVLYLFLAWYADHLNPGEEGLAMPWNFPFCSSYWKVNKSVHPLVGQNELSISSEQLVLSKASEDEKHMFEIQDVSFIGPEDRGAILITDLKKAFDKSGKSGFLLGPIINRIKQRFGKSHVVKAVDGLNLDLNRGQILAFLGHNGAGKTTTISMLSGLMLPDDGTINIFGQKLPSVKNRSSNIHVMAGLQQMLGVCPQFDTLIDSFSGIEHMELFAEIRGVRILGKINEDGTIVPGDQESLQKEYIENMMVDVSLSDKCREKVGSYSGGMKRKISLAIALLGNPCIILLDEPTTGMDVYSRNQIWQLIQDSKEGRVVILTSHSMEEADALGDRIAIMSKGKLQALGTSLFLKNRFGVGYHLNLTKKDRGDSATSPNQFDEPGLTQIIKSYLPMATVLGNSPHMITYQLPSQASDQEKYPQLFDKIEELCQKEAFGVIGFGLATTTLEEVFISLQEKE